MTHYNVRVGNKTYRINRETGEKEIVETRDFERQQFELRDGAWRPKSKGESNVDER